jgi:signal transduction histidine kinase
MMTLYFILVVTLMIIQGIVVLFARLGNSHQKLFFTLASLFCVLWTIGLALFHASEDPVILTKVAAYYYVAAAGIAWSWIPFVCTFFTGKSKPMALVSVLSLAPYVLLSAYILTNNNWLISSVSVNPNHIDLNISGYSIFVLYYLLYFMVTIGILFFGSKKVKNASSRNRINLVLVAYGAASLFGGFFNLALPFFGNYSLVWIGPLCLMIFMPIICLAIIRYRLFGIKLVIGRLMGLVVAIAVFVVASALLLNTLYPIFGFNQSSISLNVLVFALALAPFYFLMRLMDNYTNKLFSGALLNNKLFDDISRLAIDNSNVQRMLNRIARTIANNSKSTYTIVRMTVGGREFISTAHQKKILSSDLDIIYENLKKRKTGVIVAEETNNDERIYEILAANSISIVSILRDNESQKIVGMLVIGRERRMLYSDKEILALSAICDVIVIAVKNSELSKLDKVKDEFMSLASHQLRTPLTSIHGYSAMLLEGDFGKLNQEQTHALNEVLSSSERMAFLISDFLNVSRLQTGKFIIEKVPTDIYELARFEVDQLELIAKSHDVQLIFNENVGKNAIKINVDREKIGEVMANMIDNAIFYSKADSKVEISLEEKDGFIEFKVKDCGIGVPKKEQEDLFTKFFRASNARTVRPDGTGIGLFLARKIITEHDGEIIFSSVEGKGSTFGFRLTIDDL